ncbi:ribokinase [Bifidobacterium sp. ESL0728]|uniref:ribokinase n=1 Tax=Bifidobacterium sp. ESL0728 TaxID=2983220 RepID=UPI0023F62CFA|nr:ribokinase [Bifidobacterium sp. ESL0728]WEV59219.1 ribokinase [Bifidobacterium sp. ESL0728]
MSAAAISVLDHISGSVSILGSLNADYTVMSHRLPNPGETVQGGPLTILPGGKSSNQAAAAARIGANVTMFGAVGEDTNADFLISRLNDAGVDTSHINHVAGPSGTTVITVDANGENTIVYSPGSNATVDLNYLHSQEATLLKSSVLGLCLESPIEVVTAAAKICHEAGIKVLLNDSPFTATLPAQLVEYADILLVNEHEMAQLLGIEEPEDSDWLACDWDVFAAQMDDFGFHEAIVTIGGDGAMVLRNRQTSHVTAVKIKPKDTTGCGDAFMGTVLAGLASGCELDQSAALASYVATYAALGSGAQASYGTAEQVRDFIEKH